MTKKNVPNKETEAEYIPVPRPPPIAFLKMNSQKEIVVEFMDNVFNKEGKEIKPKTKYTLKDSHKAYRILSDFYALQPGSSEGVWDWDVLTKKNDPSLVDFLDGSTKK